MNAPTNTMPVVFLGHGSPMYAIEPNRYTEDWSELGRRLPKPRAILMISAHWLTRGVWVTAMKNPPTIHDFGGFSKELFEQQYPAPGSPSLAKRIKELLAPLVDVTLEEDEWGLDHGSWSLLKYLYPEADIPVIQMSLDASRNDQSHYELAKLLAPLRDEGVLIIASGNVVHNLRTINWGTEAFAQPWATEFNEYFKTRLLAHDHAALIDWRHAEHGASQSIPSPDHYWPVLYALALQKTSDSIEIVTDGIELGSISMLGFTFSAE